MKKELEKLEENLKKLEGSELVEQQHQKGKLSAKERIDLLLDLDSFVEVDFFVESRFNILGMDKKKLPETELSPDSERLTDTMFMFTARIFQK